MKRNNRFYLSIYGPILVVFISLGSLAAGNQDIFAQIRLGMEYFKEVYRLVNRNYVDDIKPEELMKSGIEGMLKALDPYTVFIEDQGIEELNQITTGKYGGVGMEIGRRDKKVIVITPMPNSPAQRAGILPGDVIIEIEGIETEALSSSKVSKLLRGEVGTTVEIKILRPVVNETLKFSLTRAEITINEVPFAGFIEPQTIYLRLTGFSSNSAASLRKAIIELQEIDEINNVILDIRGNPGGLLQEAVEIVGFFVPRGELVVYTRGKSERERTYRTHNSPILPKAKLAVLIDDGSASAAEIVAGAIQDLDRGVIIGQASFGKGLVQNVFSISNGKARLKVTTARYYVPSGRCIQKLDYNGFNHDEKSDEKKEYKTRNGRLMVEKGGIQPDVIMDREKISYFESQLWRSGYFFKYAVYHTAKHPEMNFPYITKEADIDSFYAYVKRDSFQFKIENENAYYDLLAKTEKLGQNELSELMRNADSYFAAQKDVAYEKYRSDIRKAVTLEISHNIGGERARISVSIEYDPIVINALEIVKNNNSYNLTLAIHK